MQIVFALLAHSDPQLVARLARTMTETGHRIVVHYDAKAADRAFDSLQAALCDRSDRVCFARRVRVGWGEWSVVQATLNCLDAIEAAGWEPDYVYLMSGMDYPIRASHELEQFLLRNKGDEFIESVPSDSVKWVKSGPQRERYQYRWYFNWRDKPNLTQNVFSLQRRLGMKRRFVRDMTPYLGSQWWVLTWTSLKQIMRLAREPDIVAFFKTTLVADELFFQTMIRGLVPDFRVIGCPLTLYQFTDYGYPVVYHADHLDYLTRQRFFMARKLSSHDMTLRNLLDPYWKGEKTARTFIDEDVGLRSTDYDDWRIAHREGPPTRPLVGGVGLRWKATTRRTSRPFVVLLGTSTAELRFVYRLLSGQPNLLVHGQLFHPTDIEFAGRHETFASYDSPEVQIRDVSAFDFLMDVVRAEEKRTTCFLLRWEQGGALVDTLMGRPNARIVVLNGDPLVSFSENLGGLHPRIEANFDQDDLVRVSPAAAANRFRVFLKDFQHHVSDLDKRFATAVSARPKGWIGRFDPSRIGPDWLNRLEHCIGTKVGATPESFEAACAAAAEEYKQRRLTVMRLLVEGGVDPVVFDVLRQGGGDPLMAQALL